MTENQAGKISEQQINGEQASALADNLDALMDRVEEVKNEPASNHLITHLPVNAALAEAFKKLYPQNLVTQERWMMLSTRVTESNPDEKDYDMLFTYGKNALMFYFFYKPDEPELSHGYFKAYAEEKKKIINFIQERKMTPDRIAALAEFSATLSQNLEGLTAH